MSVSNLRVPPPPHHRSMPRTDAWNQPTSRSFRNLYSNESANKPCILILRNGGASPVSVDALLLHPLPLRFSVSLDLIFRAPNRNTISGPSSPRSPHQPAVQKCSSTVDSPSPRSLNGRFQP
ncbi:hypothetical protein MLD38_025045 [Melastoma candidum]|uniref:Uncharacterized protein n=1 Tax=Melastoma candidum TaxID=119954 RepID=A0ACB9NU87_9MYRT|nr:hypothetical protein MLD38_025045 [Melastoma candidum]